MVKLARTAEFSDETLHWLDWQCGMISGVKYGGVFLTAKSAEKNLELIALWPDSNHLSPMLETLAAVTIKDGVGLVKKEVNQESQQVVDYVTHQLLQNGHVVGAVVLALDVRSKQQCQAVLQLLQWGSVFMEKVLQRATEQPIDGSKLTLNAVALFTENEPLAVAGYHLCTLLADQFDCTRVELGLSKGLQVRMLSVSHQLQFDRRIDSIRQVEFAMEECIEQNHHIVVPPPKNEASSVIQTHTKQLLKENVGAVCSIPLRDGELLFGALTLSSDNSNRFDTETINLLTRMIDHIAPVIRLNIHNDLPVWKKVIQSFNKQLQRLIGPGYFRTKLIAVTGVIAMGLLTQLQTDHVVTAQATVEGKSQQTIAAPFNSYIATASARAGDYVEKGQVLATLDDRDLRLELEKWSSEKDKQTKEYQQALALRDRAQISILSAGIAQTNAQLHSVEERLQHTQLRAPFKGLLVSGDWNQALGTPIERGQLLFELIPARNYRITLQVDEHDVVNLTSGQDADLRLTGLPEQSIPLQISRIFPIASVGQGSNNFRVESDIIKPPQGLRPGMQGTAKIVVGRGSLLKVWTYSLLSRLRLWVWSWGF